MNGFVLFFYQTCVSGQGITEHFEDDPFRIARICIKKYHMCVPGQLMRDQLNFWDDPDYNDKFGGYLMFLTESLFSLLNAALSQNVILYFKIEAERCRQKS